jgi:hypothetical protein
MSNISDEYALYDEEFLQEKEKIQVDIRRFERLKRIQRSKRGLDVNNLTFQEVYYYYCLIIEIFNYYYCYCYLIIIIDILFYLIIIIIIIRKCPS